MFCPIIRALLALVGGPITPRASTEFPRTFRCFIDLLSSLIASVTGSASTGRAQSSGPGSTKVQNGSNCKPYSPLSQSCPSARTAPSRAWLAQHIRLTRPSGSSFGSRHPLANCGLTGEQQISFCPQSGYDVGGGLGTRERSGLASPCLD